MSERFGNLAIVIMAGIAGIILLSGVAMAITAPAEEWNKTYDTTKNNDVRSVQQTSDGGYIFVAFAPNYVFGGADAWLVKTDS